MKQRKIVLESGRSFVGEAFGADRDALCELVFNTSMAGYQEILSDPSYCDQAVVMTYPLIGNYGMCDDDYETERPAIGAMIVRHYNDHPSNFRAAESLGQAMERFGIPGVSGVDTRALTRLIRSQGSQKALITDADTPLEDCLARLAGPLPSDAVSRVSRPYVTVYPAREPRFHVAAVDCGMKRNIVRSLNRLGCTVTVLPLGKYPIFGICLGHQILSLAYGARTYKLKFGHRGGNHSVRDLDTGKIEITSQNHSYAVNAGSLRGTPLTVTHVNLLDGTVEGVRCERDGAFSVQYHPESAPGPQDSAYLFDRFLANMERRRHAETY